MFTTLRATTDIVHWSPLPRSYHITSARVKTPACRHLPLVTPTDLLQDFLYRKVVASCCRALWCCCSGPCCRKYDFDDDQDVSSDDVSHVAHAQDEAGSSSANSIYLADSMEQGRGVRAVAAATSCAREATSTGSARKWTVPCVTPSVPRRLQGLAPRRPARPSRNAAQRLSQKKTPRTRSVQNSMAGPSTRVQVSKHTKKLVFEV